MMVWACQTTFFNSMLLSLSKASGPLYTVMGSNAPCRDVTNHNNGIFTPMVLQYQAIIKIEELFFTRG